MRFTYFVVILALVIFVVHGTPPGINLTVIHPSGDIDVQQNESFNVTVNVSCTGTCGLTNISLGSSGVYVLQGGDTECADSIKPILESAGYAVTCGVEEAGFNGTVDLNAYPVVIVLDGTAHGTAMPSAGQTAISEYVADGGGLIIFEWSAYETYTFRIADRPAGHTQNTTYIKSGSHQITNDLPDSWAAPECGFSQLVPHEGSVGILNETTDYGAVVVVNDALGGRVVEFGMAPGYGDKSCWNASSNWDTNMTTLLKNAVAWVASGEMRPMPVNSGSPFYTNESNPRQINLNDSEKQTLVFWVNATGNPATYGLRIDAIVLSEPTINDTSETLGVTVLLPSPYVGCVNLSNDSTYQDNISGDMESGFTVTGSITLCQDNYSFPGNPELNLTVLDVVAENVTINCTGSSLIGDVSATSICIYSDQFNTTVTDCRLFNFSAGIYFNESNNGTIEGNHISSTNYNEIPVYFFAPIPADLVLQFTNNTVIRGNNLIGSMVGLFLVGSANNTISHTNVTGGMAPTLLFGSSQNNFSNMILNNTEGELSLGLFECSLNNFFNSTFISEDLVIGLQASTFNRYLNNTIRGDFWVTDDTGSNIFNDSASGNRYYFADGNGSWTLFPAYDGNGDGWADTGSYLPYGNGTVAPHWDGYGADYHPYTEAVEQDTSSSNHQPASTPSLAVNLQSACNASFVTVTGSGDEISNAKVSVFDAGNLLDVAAGTTDENGKFVFDGCGRNVRVYVSKSGYLPADNEFALVDCSQCNPIAVTPECSNNNQCPANKECVAEKCAPLTCDCGFVQDHACVAYQCCSDSQCSDDQTCTEHACVAKIVTPQPGCTSDNDCASGKECKGQECVDKFVPPTNQADADSALSEAESAISAAKSAGREVNEAEAKLLLAQEAYDAGEYVLAEDLANQAKTLANNAAAPENPAPLETTKQKQGGTDWPLLVLAVVIAISIAGYWIVLRKR